MFSFFPWSNHLGEKSYVEIDFIYDDDNDDDIAVIIVMMMMNKITLTSVNTDLRRSIRR